jgi:hypothetical protein
MKNLHLYLSLIFVLTCAKEDSQAPNTPPTQIVKQYALTANAGDGGSVTGGGTFASGTQVSLTATPSSGYSFSGWSNGSTTNPLTITLNSNTTITANFQVIVNSYTLTVTAGEGGSVSTEGGEYEEGTEVTISATPDEGYEFIGWEGSDSDSSSLNITMNGNESLSALFQKIYFSISYDQIFVESPSSKPLIETIRNHETDDYIISSKGWLGVEMREYHSGGDYQNTSINTGYFDFSIQNYRKIDFNNDSIEDIIFTVEFFPHTIEKQSNMGFLILLNNNDGTFSFGNHLLDSEILNANHPYRFEKGDFNNDGRMDFIASNVGKPQFSSDIGTYVKGALPVLALSNSNGTYTYSTKTNMYGLNPGDKFFEDWDQDQVPDWLWSNSASVGDFNNDSALDIFLTNKIFYNDGLGNFSVEGFQFSEDQLERVYQSKAKDLNNDGYADLIFSDQYRNKKVFVLMSDFSDTSINYDKIELPPGYFGELDTRANFIETMDIDNDGFQDIIIGATRRDPYYLGSAIQVIKNEAGKTFSDQTNNFISDQTNYDSFAGQGFIDIVDFDGDNDLDIIHQTFSNATDQHGTNIYVNNNGFFEIFDFTKIPYVSWKDFDGYQDRWNNPQFAEMERLQSIFPIMIDNKNSFITRVKTLVPIDEIAHNLFYTIKPKQ